MIPSSTFRLCPKNFKRIYSGIKNLSVMNKVTQKQSAASVTSGKCPGLLSENANIGARISEPTVKYKVLPTPVKSESDNKEYKVIQLENGLTACLISDMAKVVDLNAILSEGDSESEDDDSDDFETESESEAESIKSVEDEEHDDEHKTRRPDEELKLAAAALCVGVGSFSDPKEIPGLAHFLEHMVFMGSEKFPKENDFDAFIKKHGGSDNASTDYEETTFYFECFEKQLAQALDKFAQFFIAPLMKRDSLTRERESVESEFQMAMPSDDYRKEHLLLSLANHSSCVNNFSWGNLVSLRDNISEDKLYEALHKFRKRHYSAHRMTLAVQARLPMDMLESYVINSFSAIPNNGLPPLDFSQYSHVVFDTPQFKRLYYVKPVKDICQVDLVWVMPPLLNKYRSKPHVYLASLLGHEGKGSLLVYLKKKIWALSLCAGNGESGAEYNSLYASFSISIVLTKDGFEHLKEVIDAVFSYIHLMKKEGPNEDLFREMQSIAEMSFRFEEDETACDTVEDLVENMRYYPPQDYLTGPELFYEYKPEDITEVLNYLVPDKMNIMIQSSVTPKEIVYNKTEPWFNIKHTDQEIPQEWINSWSSVEPLPDFYLPKLNQFVTTDFSLLSVEENVPQYPEKILETPVIELWYRKDQKFQLPTAYYYYYLITPLSQASPKCACILNMFVAMINLSLMEEGYPARVAELSYSVLPHESGIGIKVSGYNEKLPILLDLIVRHIKNFPNDMSEEVFQALKDKQLRGLYNTFRKPGKLCKDIRLSILEDTYFPLQVRYESTSEITFADMKQFADDVFTNLYIQGLVQGNVNKDTVLKVTENLIKELNCKPLEKLPKIKVNEIPKGQHCCRVMSFDTNNSNSIITNYYQYGLLTIKDSVILELIIMLIDEPLFDILRTKEQLGYNVYCTIRDTYGVLGYSVTINTQADKFTTQHVDSRIENFINHTHKMLKRLNDKKFNKTKMDLIKVKQCVDVDLEDEVDRNWNEIVNKKYQFDRLRQEIEAVETLKVNEVRKWWTTCNFNSKKDFRKLTVQVVGHKPTNVDDSKKVALLVEPFKIDVDGMEGLVDAKLNATTPSNLDDVKNIKEDITVIHLDVSKVDGNLDKNEPKAKLRVDAISNSGPTKSEAKRAVSTLNSSDQHQEIVKEFALIYVEDAEEIKKEKSNSYFIKDIDSFKKSLSVYPEQNT